MYLLQWFFLNYLAVKLPTIIITSIAEMLRRRTYLHKLHAVVRSCRTITYEIVFANWLVQPIGRILWPKGRNAFMVYVY